MCETLPNSLKNIILEGECATTEFKEAKNALPKNLFESICGMLNRLGGHIFLGVKDNGEIVGVDENNITEMKKHFANLCNNPEKIWPTVHLEIKDYKIDNKIILYIFVYEGSDCYRTKNNVFDRNEDGDFNITGNSSLIASIYVRKSNTYIENKVYPNVGIKDLREDLIEMLRDIVVMKDKNHPWKNMSNLDLLKSAGLYDTDVQTNKEGVNLAGILLFGKDPTILSAISYYKTDALLRVIDTIRYDDRDYVSTNLIESYGRLCDFIMKHLNDNFYVDGLRRIDLRYEIAREVCANTLMHRDYTNAYPARLIIKEDCIVIENANRPRTIGYIDVGRYVPYPKNPKIAKIFRMLGYADEAGSGIKKVVKYTQAYSGKTPTFKDGDVFQVTIPLSHQNISLHKERVETVPNYGNLDETKIKLIEFIKSNNGVSRQEINEFLRPLIKYESEAEFVNKVRSIIDYLKRNDFIVNHGTRNTSRWFTLV